MCRVMGLLGKPDGMGSEVEKYYREGRIREIADYCETDVVNTNRVWLRYELFRGRLSDVEFQDSESSLVEFVKAREHEAASWRSGLPVCGAMQALRRI
jgi:predicted PolB exonuclease-like 3'-5' exonuclease